VLLQPLPFADPDRVVTMQRSFLQGNFSILSVPQFVVWREQNQVFQASTANDFGGAINLTGGDLSIGFGFGVGVVFELDASGKETVLHSFTGGSDEANPVAGLVQGQNGHLYGITFDGGASGFGVVFKL
jgi:hypothetical protein